MSASGHRVLGLWTAAVLLALGCWLPAIEAPTPIAGPWSVLHADGSVRIALEFPSATPADRLVHIHLRRPDAASEDGEPQLLAAERGHQVITRPLSKPSQLLSFHIPRELTFVREVSIWLGSNRQLRVRMPRLTHAEGEARVILVGGRLWPSARDIAALAEAMGGQPQAVIVLDRGWESQLGSGGWEADLPLIVPDARDSDPLLRALVGPAADWRGGIDLGPLAMPLIQDPSTAALTMAAFLQSWVVPIERAGLWRLDREALPEQQQPGRLALLIDAAHRHHQLPLVLLSAGGAGFISDPLVAEDARTVRAAAGGVRVVSPIAEGQAAINLPPEVALPVDRGSFMALQADSDQLRLLVLPSVDSAGSPLSLSWDRALDGARQSPLWGLADPEQRHQAWYDDGDDEALAALAWLPLPALHALAMDSEHLRRLLANPHPDARLLLRRMSAGELGSINEWISVLGPEATRIGRDLILRSLADPRRHELRFFAQLVVDTQDPEVVRSLVRVAEQQQSLPLLNLLRRRLQLQADGDVPLDTDPMLQYAVSHALFDSPYLSPTPLRPLALALRERLQPLARPPIERFLARHGVRRGLE